MGWRDNFIILRVPAWGFEYGEAAYYGWRHFLHIGPITFWWGLIRQDFDPTPWGAADQREGGRDG